MYTELHLHSNHSFLHGASAPADYAERAAALGMSALAVTDHQGLYGAIKHRNACREAGIRPIYGATVTLAAEPPGAAREDDGVPRAPGDGPLPGGRVVLLAEDARGWASLCRLLSEAGLAGSKHHRPASWAGLARHAEGLICLTGGAAGPPGLAAARGDRAATLASARALKAIYGPGSCYVELHRHMEAGERRREATMLGLAAHLDLPTVATNAVHYARPEGQRLQHVLTCIRERTTLDGAGARLFATPHRYLKGEAEMRGLFVDLPEALRAGAEIAERCRVELDHSAARLPAFPAPEGETAYSHLLGLCYAGLRRRFDPVTPQALEQLAHELRVIERCALADYFLVVHDIVDFARREGIPCQGRGSAAGSLVAYCLGITPVDPLAQGLLFERFLAEGAASTPDIDVDFAADRREEVLQYVYRRYGQERTAMVANVVTFRARSAVADVGRALGFPEPLLAQVRRHLHTRDASKVGLDLAEVESFQGKMGHLPWRLLVELCTAIDGFPRHLSIHSGGMLVTSEPLCELVPLEPATMPGRVVVQWDKDDVEDAGLIKIDLLSLRTLGMVAECFARIEAAGGPALDFDGLPAEDEATWEMMRAADTIGCFQIESRAQLALLPRLRPRAMSDLVVEVALIRPGPVQGGMAKAYLRRRDGEEAVGYWHPSLEPVLAETLGILVFQEQVLRVAMTVAGFDGAQADGLRRAMSRKRSREAMERWRGDFVRGAGARGVETEVAEGIFDRLLGFAAYGFCKSHAAAFARVSWVTAWLKCHHPLPFVCALLNAQPMGFYTVEAVLQDARRHGIGVLPLHANRSAERWEIEGQALRVPFVRLKGMGAEEAARIVAARTEDGAFTGLWDFLRRARPSRRGAERLVRAGALDGLPEDGDADRRQLLWKLGEMRWDEGELGLPPVHVEADLPPVDRASAVATDYELLGLSQHEHLLSLLRERLAERDVATCAELPDLPMGGDARIAGRIEVLQRPGTAKGVAFATLEDETGLANLVFYPADFERCRRALRAGPVVIAGGRVQHEQGVSHLITTSVTPVALPGEADADADDAAMAAAAAGAGPGKVFQ